MSRAPKFLVILLLTSGVAMAETPLQDPALDLTLFVARETAASPLRPASFEPPPFIPAMPFSTEPSAPTAAAEPLAIVLEPQRQPASFQWMPAIRQSSIFLGIQLGTVIAIQPWSRAELPGPFFKDWGLAVKGIREWDDGDPFIDNYIGHPVQGALTGYIQVQNDPRYRDVQFGLSKRYWMSRLRAMGFTALYSTQFEIGPISEASLGNLGKHEYIASDGSITTGAGYVDLVVTPVGGLAWMVVEDAIDRFVSDKLERAGHRKWANFFRAALNPARSGANILRGKAPWHRDRAEVAPPQR